MKPVVIVNPVDTDLDRACDCLAAYKADPTVAQSFGLPTADGTLTVVLPAKDAQPA